MMKRKTFTLEEGDDIINRLSFEMFRYLRNPKVEYPTVEPRPFTCIECGRETEIITNNGGPVYDKCESCCLYTQHEEKTNDSAT